MWFFHFLNFNLQILQKNNMQPFTYLLKNWTTFLGGTAFILGIILWLMKNWLLELAIISKLMLKPNSRIVDTLWKKMPDGVPTNMYFFNWSNPEDFHNSSIKPHFKTVGPYGFTTNMEKTNIIWNDNNTVTYNQMRFYTFNEKYNNKTLSDNITTINIITLGASHYLKNWNYAFKKALSMLIATKAPDIHITRTINQLIFEGYDDFITDIAQYFPFIAPKVPRLDKFSLLRIINGSETFEGVYNVGTGANGNFEIQNWDYNSMTPYFNGSCAKVHGSTGELYSLHPSKDHIGVFVPLICRYMQFDFEEEVIVDGILGYKYSLGDGALDNGTLIPGNECYCTGHCIPSGMINISPCRYDVPLYVSLPNFYQADPIYLNAVEGLESKKAKHESYVILEPLTALPLKVVFRLQLNILLQPVEYVTLYENVPRMFFPILWSEVNATPSDIIMAELKQHLNIPYIYMGIIIALVTVGLYLLIYTAFKSTFVSLYRKTYKQAPCVILASEEVPLQ